MYATTKPYKSKILELIRKTWQTPYVDVKPGAYPIIKKKFSFLEVQHTDGIGTKGFYHWQKRTFKNAVLDALAMNLNDFLMVGAIPYAIQNHIVLPEDDYQAIVEIIGELVRQCRKRKIAITGGETSIHNNAKGLDISITVSGFIKCIRENKCRAGDVLIGLKSNGLHSNGFTKVREIFGSRDNKEFTKPTAIYFDKIFPLLQQNKINGLMHITGGAFTKLKDLLDGSDIIISQPLKLRPQEIFYKIYQKGVSSKDMYSTFNCGVGLVLSVPKKEVKKIISHLPNTIVIGKVVQGSNCIHVQSAFDGKWIKL